MKRARKRASSVAVIDIGSNSVRLVVYETMARSLITIFNEKALCGLGREVQSMHCWPGSPHALLAVPALHDPDV